MNNVEEISRKTVDPNMLQFSLSPLHARVIFMECLLHISYRLDFKTWQIKGEENKKKAAERKKKNNSKSFQK